MCDINVKAEDLTHVVTSSIKRPDKIIEIHEGHNYFLSWYEVGGGLLLHPM